MQDILSRLRDTIDRHCIEPTTRSVVPGLLLFRADAPTTPMDVVYEPRFCVIVQGSKQVMLCDKVFDYDASKYLVTAVDLPVTGQVTQATPEKPYLALCLALDPAQIADLLLEMRDAFPSNGTACPSCMTVSTLTHEILGPVTRLVGLLENPEDIPILLPAIIRELLYRLLQGPQGYVLRQIATAGTNLSQLNRAIGWIRAHYAEAFDIASVAKIAGMSPSSFHRHFRAATMMSPLQYRTRLRLQEARRRLLSATVDAAEAGFAVGYDSPSQFSREYRRMFGVPPARDAQRLRYAGEGEFSA
ncbi:AraC family transcriptional regulator [Gluconobacter thailandicus]|uniref:AraC family transcriptional regulator n=1 Tax=Gluconobacter thailandicus TaxID=257438 RepID=A0AAP9JJ11_GLUTH|nr:AraC family transcriptional regulator [Gluconobacter thailandicus]KXV34784.1 AraC family transcriptional regulator [Gluconobacter thailandicus]QEH96994.1 AraC family transcriptional regulator [Gluconobacter thailandicus]